MRKDNTFYLVKEDNETGDKQYFDFEAMGFSSDRPKPVVISTIDALTTMFDSGEDLLVFAIRDREVEGSYKFYIESKLKNKDETKLYEAVFNDKALSALSKVSDGNVDFTGSRQFGILMDMMNEIGKQESPLAFQLTDDIHKDNGLNKDSKALVIAHNSDNSVDLITEYVEQFSSYIQCRTLYLGYKEYIEGRSKATIKILEWKQN